MKEKSMLVQVALYVEDEKDKWYIDNGYSTHMTSDKSNFFSLKKVNEGMMKFGDNAATSIKGKGNLVWIMEELKLRIYYMLKD